MLDKLLDQLINDLSNNNFESFKEKFKEDKYIDFKNYDPLINKTDDGRIELASDIASYANTSGGLIVYGISENNKIPTKFNPFSVNGNRIENIGPGIDSIIRRLIEPNLSCSYHPIPVEDNKLFYIIKINKSWNAPHGVYAKEDVRFYGRSKEGYKFIYKYTEIKNKFIMGELLANKMKVFREYRVNQIITNQGILPLQDNAKVILHVLPISAFDSNLTYDVNKFSKHSQLMQLITSPSRPLTIRKNFDGVLAYDQVDSKPHAGYIQIYRDGIIEVVDACGLAKRKLYNDELHPVIPKSYEGSLISSLNDYLKILLELGVRLPIFYAVTLVNVKGYFIINGYADSSESIDRDILFITDEELLDFDFQPEHLLNNTFNLIYNACGIDRPTV